MVSSAFTTKHANAKEKAPEALVLQKLYTSIIMRAKVACTLTRQLSRACRRSSSRAERHHVRPDTVLPHGAVTAGVEAPRQRRAQRAEGKRLRGVASVAASTSAAPEQGCDSLRTLFRLIPIRRWRYVGAMRLQEHPKRLTLTGPFGTHHILEARAA